MTTLTMNTTIASAIVAMARGTVEYNRGVLAALGQESLAIRHAGAKHRAQRVAEQREKTGGIFDPSPLDADQEQANADERAAWEPIEALIQQARAYLDDAPDAPPAYGTHV